MQRVLCVQDLVVKFFSRKNGKSWGSKWVQWYCSYCSRFSSCWLLTAMIYKSGIFSRLLDISTCWRASRLSYYILQCYVLHLHLATWAYHTIQKEYTVIAMCLWKLKVNFTILQSVVYWNFLCMWRWRDERNFMLSARMKQLFTEWVPAHFEDVAGYTWTVLC